MKVLVLKNEDFQDMWRRIDKLALELRERFGQQSAEQSHAVSECFRSFNYHFVKWAQSHGADKMSE